MKQPLNSRPPGYALKILVDKVEEKSAGGIFLPGQALERQQLFVKNGTVVEMGPDAYDPETYKTPWCKVGDRIYFRADIGFKVHERGKEYTYIKDNDLVAVITEYGEYDEKEEVK